MTLSNLFIVVVMWVTQIYPDHSTSHKKVVKAVSNTKEVCSVTKKASEYKVYKVTMLPGMEKPIVQPIEVYCER